MLASFNKDFQVAWKLVDRLVEPRYKGKVSEKEAEEWPDWLFMPFAGWMAIAEGLLGVSRKEAPGPVVTLMHKLATLGTWRLTQDIVRFDPTVRDEICATPLTGNIPMDIFKQLPAWCIYVDAPVVHRGDDFSGFFVLLEKDTNTGQEELRFFFNAEDHLMPAFVYLGPHSVEDAIEKPNEVMRANSQLSGLPHVDQTMDKGLMYAMSLTMYLCAYGFPGRTGVDKQVCARLNAKKTRKGWRTFPPDKVTVREIGNDLGEAIRKSLDGNVSHRETTGTHASPRPHIRRAHWHGFWRGPKNGERTFALQWLPPIAVAAVATEEDR